MNPLAGASGADLALTSHWSNSFDRVALFPEYQDPANCADRVVVVVAIQQYSLLLIIQSDLTFDDF